MRKFKFNNEVENTGTLKPLEQSWIDKILNGSSFSPTTMDKIESDTVYFETMWECRQIRGNGLVERERTQTMGHATFSVSCPEQYPRCGAVTLVPT